MNKTLILAGLTLASVASCNSEPNKPKEEQPAQETAAPAAKLTINDLKWLVGKWQNTTPDGLGYENWTMINDSTFAAVAGFIKGKDTMVLETISLEQRNGELNYIPTVKDQNEGKPVAFKLTEAAGDSVVFSNPGHDFPNKITYTKKSEKSILAKISGKIQGQDHSELFPMTKVD